MLFPLRALEVACISHQDHTSFLLYVLGMPAPFCSVFEMMQPFGIPLLTQQLREFSLGISQQASKVQSINLNNFGLSVGLSLENFDIGILYNIGIKNVKQVFAPSIFELYLTFDFSKFRRNNRGLYKRLQIDNYF